MPLVSPQRTWQKQPVTIPSKPARPDAAPALFRLLSDSALSRAAFGACGIPLALLDANAKGRPSTSVNAAFEAFFGHRQGELAGRPLAALFRGDEALAERVLSDAERRWELDVRSKDGTLRHVELAFGGLRAADGRLTHWVLAFSDRAEVHRLRAEVEQLKALAASPLELRLDPSAQPARGAQKPAVEAAPADELRSDRKTSGILHQR